MCSPSVIACVRLRVAVFARASCLEAFCWRKLVIFFCLTMGEGSLRLPLWMLWLFGGLSSDVRYRE